jgi:hypothetical protein
MNLLYKILLGGCCLLGTFSVNAFSPIPSRPVAFYYSPVSPGYISHFLHKYFLAAYTTCISDVDKDGVCGPEDCAPFNPNIPAPPGAACDDKNAFTKDDKIQADRCTCMGTNIIKDMPITISLGEDRILADGESVTISTSVLQQNTCITTSCRENAELIASWDLDNCKAELIANQTTKISNFYAGTLGNDFCANVVTKTLMQAEGIHSCSPTSYSPKAKQAMNFEMPKIEKFQNKHPKALQFEVILDQKENVSKVNKITFMQKTADKLSVNGHTHNNNYPTQYALRILKGGKEIYKSLDMPTAKKWTEAVFDFTNEPIFEIASTTVFTIELLAYGADPAKGELSMWTIDDLKVYGSCCKTTSSQASKYLWSTGERTNSIKVDRPGDYVVTVTDCNGTTSADQIRVTLAEASN